MKKNTTAQRNIKQAVKHIARLGQKHTVVHADCPITIGMDLGDRTSRFCLLDENGKVQAEGAIATTRAAMAAQFGLIPPCRVAFEVGTHSPWISRLLGEFGHEVIVANARQLQLISKSSRKDDRVDAATLARLARIDPEMLRPVQHRSEQAHRDLLTIRVRAALVEARTRLINAVRGMAKSLGERVPACDAAGFNEERLKSLPAGLDKQLKPLVEQVEALSRQIRQLDAEVEQLARTEYPETQRLRQVSGVGPLISLAYVLTLEDKARFSKSRAVGCYIGLRPKRSQSGERDPQLRITKEGDIYLRKLLVQAAHCIMQQRSPDTDLKRWGEKLSRRGGKNAKKRAVVAVARKLAILLHRLWVSGETYEPLRNARSQAAHTPQAA